MESPEPLGAQACAAPDSLGEQSAVVASATLRSSPSLHLPCSHSSLLADLQHLKMARTTTKLPVQCRRKPLANTPLAWGRQPQGNTLQEGWQRSSLYQVHP